MVDKKQIPLCPITGKKAIHFVQWLHRDTLIGLWRHSFGVDTSALLADVPRFGLWESPAGLMFFDPPIAGDAKFYTELYRRHSLHQRLAGAEGTRPEFRAVGALAKPGMKVLDVGCGDGGFRPYVKDSEYWGLDPNFGGTRPDILAEPIEEHAPKRPEYYDLVCSFQVIEHVPDPVGFAQAMVAALKPGGLLVLGVPSWPAPVTEIPNYVMNAPPHHLTWWNEASLRALAERLGLRCREVRDCPVGSHSSVIYWMARFAPAMTKERYFRAAWSWHLALIWCWLTGSAADALFRVPAGARTSEIMLIAEKPVA